VKKSLFSRRQTLLSGAGGMGSLLLKSLATGLPASFLMNPEKALAEVRPACGTQSKAQFIILSASSLGDPLNANVPGTYGAGIMHPTDPEMAATDFMLGSKQVRAAKPWSLMPESVRQRMSFWHLKTNTPVHPDQPDVLKLRGAIRPAEMFPSVLSKHLAQCLGTIQSQPITVGAQSPSEGLTYLGASLPILPPISLRDTLLARPGALSSLAPLRDQTLNNIAAILKTSGTKAQRDYVDSLVTSQSLVRNIPQTLVSDLAALDSNAIEDQINAAITLIKMKVSPVITVHFDFGGDNHFDAGLTREATSSIASIAGIRTLMSRLEADGLSDQVTFLSLNVFGRTLGAAASGSGRNHNANHQVSVAIGKAFKPGVIGGVAADSRDFSAVSINSTTGAAAGTGGDVSATETLASFGKSVMAGLGITQATIDSTIPGGKVIQGGLA
jgi:hypothetical protein